MRLTSLRLDRYGAFTGLAVSLGPGLTVVYGPNEAGKSTLLHAIGDALWGLVPRQHAYAFEVAPSRLQITAEVDGTSGTQAVTVTGRGWRSSDGAPVEPWWADGPVANRQAWDVGFGIDRDRLRDGGRAVLRDGGDLADLLFQARTGVDLAAARARLVEEADAIWKRHRNARNVSLRAAKERADGFASQLVEAIHAADAVAELEQELRRAESDLTAARAAHTRAVAAKEAAQRDDRAYRHAVRLAGIRREIGDVAAAGCVLSEVELSRCEDAATALEVAEQALQGLDADLVELDATPLPPPDPDALSVAELVEELRRGDEAEAGRGDRMQRLHGQVGSLLSELRAAAAELDPALALADEVGLRRAAPTLALPADTADLLNRLAGQIADAQRIVDEAAGERRAAEGELLPGAPAGERGALGRWEEARQARDRAWGQVRGPWLTGELPEAGERAALASGLDGALVATDVAAGAAAVEAEELVEAQTRAEERQRRLEAARRKHEASAEVLATLVERWRLAVRGCGLPEALDAPAWQVRWSAVERVSELLAELAGADAHVRELAGESSAFRGRVEGALRPLGIDSGDTLPALAAAYERVRKARQAEVAAAERDRQRASIASKQAREEATQKQAGQILEGLAARTEGDLDAVVNRSRCLLDLRQTEQSVLGELRAAAPDDDPDDLATRLPAVTVEAIKEAVGVAGDDADDAVGELEAEQERRANLAEELRRAKQDGDAAALRQQEVDALDEMAELARRWARLQVMAGLLDRVARAVGSRADASLLQHAGSLAGTLTGGRVQGLSAADGAGDTRSLVVHLSGDQDAEACDLSEGTADQVFLALRLAGIRQRQDAATAGGSETLPVVLDDVLMAHDDVRTEAALGLLVEEARDQQIVLFTHHRAVAEAAKAVGAVVVSLEAPFSSGDVRPGSGMGRPSRLGPVSERAQQHFDADPAAVRAWARQHGLAVGDRGRIPGEIIAAYQARERPGSAAGRPSSR